MDRDICHDTLPQNTEIDITKYKNQSRMTYNCDREQKGVW